MSLVETLGAGAECVGWGADLQHLGLRVLQRPVLAGSVEAAPPVLGRVKAVRLCWHQLLQPSSFSFLSRLLPFSYFSILKRRSNALIYPVEKRIKREKRTRSKTIKKPNYSNPRTPNHQSNLSKYLKH